MDSLPEIVEKFDTLRYTGTATGNLNDLALNGAFLTSLGNADTDFSINFNNDYDDARYTGLIKIRRF